MYGFQVGPVILGIILGPLMDVSYRRAMISTGDDPLAFLGEFFTESDVGHPRRCARR